MCSVIFGVMIQCQVLHLLKESFLGVGGALIFLTQMEECFVSCKMKVEILVWMVDSDAVYARISLELYKKQ